MKKTMTFSSLFSLAALLGPVLPAQALENMTFHGKLVEPPSCVINNDEVMDVDFGELRTDKIDGESYSKLIDYKLDCINLGGNSTLLKIQGDASGFDQDVLKTDVADLGIQLYADGKKVKVNEDIPFTYSKPPKLSVIPKKKTDAVLKGGDFRASATMLVEFR